MEGSLLTIHQSGFAPGMEIISPWTPAGPVSSTPGVGKFPLLLEDTKSGRKSKYFCFPFPQVSIEILKMREQNKDWILCRINRW